MTADRELDALFLHSILHHVPNMVFVKDAKDLRFVLFNAAAEELLGAKSEDMIGKNDYDFFPEEQAAFFQAKDRAVLAGGGKVDIPREPIDTPNGLRWLRTQKVAIMEDGEAKYLLGISEDITELVAKEAAIEEKNRALENFSAMVAHDLSNMLTASSGAISMIGDGLRAVDGPKSLLKWCDRLEANHSMMNGFITSMLQVATSNVDPAAILETPVVKLVEAARTQLHIYDQSGVNFEVRASIEIAIYGQPGLLVQVLANLLGNALKYRKRGQPLEIVVDAEVSGDVVLVAVKDNGIGIAPAALQGLTDIFNRADARADVAGYGIGLFLVRSILDAHKGSIAFESEPGSGTVVRLRFPLAPGQAARPSLAA